MCLRREEGQGLLHEEAYDTRFRRALPRRQDEDRFSFKRASCRPYSTQASPTPCVFFFVLCWSCFACAVEHETKANCNKAKAAAVKLSGTLLPSTVTGHGPGMPIDVDGPADAATTALAAALDAALAATATQQSGNSGADSKRKRRELGPAVELPGVPPAASLGAAPTAPPNAPPRKKNASGEHVLEALQASMGHLTERFAVLQRKLADLDAQHTGLLEETRGLRV